MSKSMLKWKVVEKPTGRYRGFYNRGWPSCEHKESGRPLFRISCDDEYTNGKPPHAPLFLHIAIHSPEHGEWRWHRWNKSFSTLAELKIKAAELFEKNHDGFI